MSLVKHWFRTSFHPLRELARDPSPVLPFNPKGFTIWGIRRHLEVIEMHREYFLGSKKAKQPMKLVVDTVEREVVPVIEEHLSDKSIDWYFN